MAIYANTGAEALGRSILMGGILVLRPRSTRTAVRNTLGNTRVGGTSDT